MAPRSKQGLRSLFPPVLKRPTLIGVSPDLSGDPSLSSTTTTTVPTVVHHGDPVDMATSIAALVDTHRSLRLTDQASDRS